MKKLAFYKVKEPNLINSILLRSWVNFYSFWKVFDFRDEFVSDGFKFHGKWNLKHNLSSIFSMDCFYHFFCTMGLNKKIIYTSQYHFYFVYTPH